MSSEDFFLFELQFIQNYPMISLINTQNSEQNDSHFLDDILKKLFFFFLYQNLTESCSWGPIGNNSSMWLQWNLNQIKIFFHKIDFENVICEMQANLLRPKNANTLWPSDAI